MNKCPACGSGVDAQAFHCPTWQSEFCFHFRTRVLPPDAQLHCINQACDDYGKLICAKCDQEEEDEASIHCDPEDG